MNEEIYNEETCRVGVQEGMKKVVYLLGAGASHGSAKWSGSSTGILMSDLADDIAERFRKSINHKFRAQSGISDSLINEILDPESDVEQIITFLEESESPKLLRIAEQLRRDFRESLSSRLDLIANELTEIPAKLYAVLIDLHLIQGFSERLCGILTLNYDSLIEYAISSLHEMDIDYGIHTKNPNGIHEDRILLLKLHGSFDWISDRPISILNNDGDNDIDSLWIPPGIQKEKARYPFNLLWGKAQELLDCDVFRIVGCNLSANDWDLISMLFRSKHGHPKKSCEIEFIDTPRRAREIQRKFPYLKISSLLDLNGIGQEMVLELMDRNQTFNSLNETDQEILIRMTDNRIPNPFFYWLRLKAEQVNNELSSVRTERGYVSEFLDSV